MSTPPAFVGSPAPTAAVATAPRGFSLFKPMNPPITDWRGLRVWLVGASSGIGEAIASALHARGAQVLVSARSRDALDSFVLNHPPLHGMTAQAWPLDVTDADAVAAATRDIVAQGPLDLVVYCAAHYREMRATGMDLPDLKRHMDINYMGALHVLGAAVPAMTARGQGHISIISSTAGFRGLPKGLAYGPTKAALTHLAENVYFDLRPLGVGVSVVHPGFVQTPSTAQNDFTMPALITAPQAAQAMIDDWGRGVFQVHYPKRFTRWMKLMRLLPYRAYFAVVRRVTGL